MRSKKLGYTQDKKKNNGNYKGRLQQPEEFENIVIKSLPDGEVLRLKDIAEIQLDRLGYNFTNRVDGHKSVTCIVYQMAGTNADMLHQFEPFPWHGIVR